MKKLLTLAYTFFYVSVVTLGGGMAMIPVMQREFVEKREWLTPEEMLDIVTVMQSLPGLIGINMSILIGHKIAGVLGAIVSMLATVSAPFFIIVLLAAGKSMLGESVILNKIFMGVRAGVAALILASAIQLGKSIFKSKLAWVLGIISFVASVYFEVEAISLIVLGAFVGIVLMIIDSQKTAEEEKKS